MKNLNGTIMYCTLLIGAEILAAQTPANDNSKEVHAQLCMNLLNNKNISASKMLDLARTFRHLGDVPRAIEAYEHLAAILPSSEQLNNLLRELYTLEGNFNLVKKRWPYDNCPWQDLEKVHGKRVVFKLCQGPGFGYGDIFMQLRYAQMLKDAGAWVILVTNKHMFPILLSSPFIDELIDEKNELPAHDMQLSIDWNAYCYFSEQTFAEKKDRVPYLWPSASLVNKWRNRIVHDGKPNIGLCWHSSMIRTAENTLAPNPRTIPLEILAQTLAQFKHAHWYSLQCGHGKDDYEKVATILPITTFDNEFDTTHGRFMDTAAVMAQLDLFITVDTSLAHLAGAMGIPVFILLPRESDWRWFANRHDSPWYPTMRLFRTPCCGTWDDVMTELAHVLHEMNIT